MAVAIVFLALMVGQAARRDREIKDDDATVTVATIAFIWAAAYDLLIVFKP